MNIATLKVILITLSNNQNIKTAIAMYITMFNISIFIIINILNYGFYIQELQVFILPYQTIIDHEISLH